MADVLIDSSTALYIIGYLQAYVSEHSMICHAISWSSLIQLSLEELSIHTVAVARSVVVQTRQIYGHHNAEGWEGRRGIANQKNITACRGYMSDYIRMTDVVCSFDKLK